MVADFFAHDRLVWRVPEFQHLLPLHVFAEILAMPPPAPNIGPDKVVWGLTSDGFSLRRWCMKLVRGLMGGVQALCGNVLGDGMCRLK